MTLEQINAQACDQAPIHCLPDEILGVIFLINTSKLVEQGNKNHPYDPHATTIATTQVCQRWRAVALDYSLLWGRIINYEEHSPSRIAMLLARSGSSLIDVGGDSVFEAVKLQNPRGKLVLQYIFQQITRLKTFSLHIRRDPWASICRSFLSHPAPNLEFLNLITSCPFPDCLYPNPLFTNVAPRLRRLHLQRCLIDFSSSVLSNLTELSVRDVLTPSMWSASEQSHPLKVAPSVAGWLRVLKNIPTLRFLTLSSAISHFTEPDPLPVVNLPYLTLLTIGARFYQGMSLIDHINIPPSCGINFRLYRSRSTDGLDGLKLLSFLSKHLTHWSQDHSDRYLQAKVLSGNRIHFGNFRRIGQVLDNTESDEVEAHRRLSKDPILSLVLTFDASQNSFSFFNQLLELYSFTFLTTTTLDLWLDQEFARTARTAGSFSSLHTFHYFTNVKTLNLLEQSPVHLLPLFQNSSLPDHPLFPALQSLCLTGTAMDHIVGVLVAFLQWRVAAGIPLSEINGGSISSQMVEQLSRVGNLRVTPSGLLDSSPLRHYVRETDAEDEI